MVRRKLRTALTFSPHDWGLLLEAWSALLAIDLGLRLLPFRRLRRLAASQSPLRAREELRDTLTLQRLARLVDAAARHHLYPMRCLPRALALQWVLGRRGIRADLRIGVQRDEDGLAAHAWLEYQGRPIGEPEGIEARFAPLAASEGAR